MTMPVFSGVYRAVSESDLVGLIPTQLALRVAPKAGLEVFEPPMAIPPALIAMIWHKRSTATPAHRWLRDLIAEVLLPLNDGQDPLPEPGA
jgi:DNA-binding transcriptional LysR family regulator